MSVLVEEHIKNIQNSIEQIAQETFANAKHKKVRSLTPLLNLLLDIEAKPLRVDEMRMLRSTVVDYIQKNDLQAEKDFMRIVTKRFSMAYLPGISYSGLQDYLLALDKAGFGHVLQQYITNWYDIIKQKNPPSPKHNMHNTHSNNNTRLQPTSSDTSSVGPERSIASPVKPMRYIMCSFRRNQSALWTSYRLYLDGVHEVNANGDVIKSTLLEQPVMLLGAKRFKSGISAQCHVWNVEDSKLWKEKSAVARITRNANVYLGIPCSPSALPSQDTTDVDPNTNNNDNNESEPVGSVPTSHSLPSEPTDKPTKSTDAVTTTDLSAAVKLMGKDLFDDGPVSIAVQTKGQEKFIQLTIALHKRYAAVSATTATNEEIINDLEQLVRNPIGFSTTASSTHTNQSLPYLVLRSKAPRKLTDTDATNSNNNNNNGNSSNNNNHNATSTSISEKAPGSSSSSSVTNSNMSQSQFGLSFGKHSRIRVASRKNVVADTWIDMQHTHKRVALNNDWTTVNADAIPLLQVGKIDEDRFAVDFHSISPFQAFVVAMAVFDQ